MNRDDLTAKLEAGITNLTTSERWTAWLSVQRKFHRYSFQNSLLIAIQYPNASQVAGFNRWVGLGRMVRKGEKAIWILAPTMRKKIDKVTGEERNALAGFRSAYVFDIEQTEGEPLPEIVSQLDGDDGGLLARLEAVAVSRGISVKYEPSRRHANGWWLPAENAITINTQRATSARQQAKTLAHELAHSILHVDGYKGTPRPVAELEAESVAYIVCGEAGLDSGDYTFGYVAHWSGGDADTTIANIRASGQRISKTAREITDAAAVVTVITEAAA